MNAIQALSQLSYSPRRVGTHRLGRARSRHCPSAPGLSTIRVENRAAGRLLVAARRAARALPGETYLLLWPLGPLSGGGTNDSTVHISQIHGSTSPQVPDSRGHGAMGQRVSGGLMRSPGRRTSRRFRALPAAPPATSADAARAHPSGTRPGRKEKPPPVLADATEVLKRVGQMARTLSGLPHRLGAITIRSWCPPLGVTPPARRSSAWANESCRPSSGRRWPWKRPWNPRRGPLRCRRDARACPLPSWP